MALPNPTDTDLALEIYQYFLRLSRGKAQNLPRISEIAKNIGITRQAIYSWVAGEFSCPVLASYLNSVTDISVPVRIESKDFNAMRQLLRIR